MAPAPAIRNFIVFCPRWSSPLVIRERGGDCAPANFSGGGGGDTLHEINLLRTFVFRQQLAAVLDECRLGGAMGLMQDHGGSHFFTQGGMQAAKCERGRDGE